MGVTKQRHFEILRAVLSMVEERVAIPLADATAAVGVGAAELRALLDPVLFLEFREPRDGELVSMARAFLLTENDVLQIDEGHWLRNLQSTPPDRETALALLVAGTTMQALATAPTPELDRAVQKLAREVDVILRVPVEQPAHLATVQRAWADGRSLRIRYLADGADAPREHEVLPRRVFSQWGHWYLHARALDEEHPKYYRVDRILEAAVGDVAFDPPDDDAIPEWFDLSEHARTVRVRMRPEALESLPAPHQLGEASRRGDGTVELDITVAGDRRLEHLLVCLPADAEVLAPPQYAALRRVHASQLLAAYSEPPV